MRYLALLIAVLLDGLQILLGLGFAAMQFITPAGGAAVGAGAGLSWCWQSSSGIWALLDAAKCVAAGGVIGGALSAFAIPIGAAVDVALSLTIGGGIIMLLAFDGAFYTSTVIKGFLAEAAPFLNILPVWTGMVYRCIQRKKQEEQPIEKSKAVQQPPRAQVMPSRMHDIN